MKPSKANLLFHPVRLRIAQVLTGGQHLTAQQIAQQIPRVPQASLYRHLNLLVEGGILTVADERQVQNRNLVEKVYTLDLEAATLRAQDLAHASQDDHRRYFTLFLLMLLDDFERFLQSGERLESIGDTADYQHHTLYLSEVEARQLLADLRAVRAMAQAHPPSPERQRRYLALTLMPGFEEPADERSQIDRPNS
jgi:DNA-binding transcriptional ArsR family regulator